MSDFSLRPFVAGSLTGLRAFKVDALGRLTGCSYQAVFTPGENAAKCAGAGAYTAALQGAVHNYYYMTFGGQQVATVNDPQPTKAAPPHQVASVDCSCGFYAYFDGTNTYHDAETVQALVEGYGVCTVGARGFRAEKARLVALVLPEDEAPGDPHPRWDRWSDWNYENGGPNTGLVVLGGILSIPGAMASLAGIAAGHLLAVIGLVASIVLGGTATAAMSGWTHGLHRNFRLNHPELECARPETLDALDDRLDLVRRNYPDVPVYRTVAEAVAAHPLTRPPDPTPDDQDFWTRSLP